jgi:hypothetical protein
MQYKRDARTYAYCEKIGKDMFQQVRNQPESKTGNEGRG